MSAPLWLTESDVLQLLDLGDAIEVLTRAYGAAGQAEARALQRAHARHGETILHAVGGMLPAAGIAGTKTWVYSPRGASPLLVLFSLADGRLVGVVEAFALGRMRTAATSGVGTAALAREDAAVLALLGTGRQALAQAQAVAAVRPLRALRVLGRDPGRLAAFAARAADALAVPVTQHTELAAALDGAEIVTTITRAAEPFLGAELLAPGVHVNAVGAIVPSRAELTAEAVGHCDAVVADAPEQARHDSGELRAAVDAGLLGWDAVAGLADVLAEPSRGRRAREDVTLFKALGVGLSDVALGAELLERARATGAGAPLPATAEPDLVAGA